MTLKLAGYSGFSLPDDHILKVAQKKAREFNPISEKAIVPVHEAHKDISAFLDKAIDKEFAEIPYNTEERTGRINLLFRDLFILPEIPNYLKPLLQVQTTLKEKIETLKRKLDEANQSRTEMGKQLIPLGRDLTDFLKKHKTQWAQAIDQLRLAPDNPDLELPHPDNIRVIASSRQTSGSFGRRLFETLPWSAKQLIDGLEQTDSFDAAIDYAQQQVLLVDAEDTEGKFGDTMPMPHIEKPIATKRTNNMAWKKSENTSPWVKRIVILIPTEDGSEDGKRVAEKYQSIFDVCTPDEFAKKEQQRPYRVDKLIVVKGPTAKEKKQNIAMNDKIHDAFKEVQQFAEVERQKTLDLAKTQGTSPEEALKRLQFEGFSSWTGHGHTDPKKGPGREDDRKFMEGSQEYVFFSDPDRHQLGTLDETTIKQWEHQYLKDYRYFVHQIGTCGSAAFIA